MSKTNTPFKNTSGDKKMSVYAFDGTNTRLIHFGAKGYSDFTIHGDPERKQNYINRHKNNEDWDKSGVLTAGFWSRWILWNLPTIKQSVEYTQKKFKLVVKNI